LNTSVLICFEDVFPHGVGEYVDEETDFLVNLTNNGWFGESAAQWQHAVAALFRAVENGVPLVRCANNGLSCWVDPCGGLHEVYFGASRDIYGAGFKIARIPIPPRRAPGDKTFYHRHGDWFGWMCVGLTSALGGRGLLKRRRI
jgi:apolipoprotein N-acyltransferase